MAKNKPEKELSNILQKRLNDLQKEGIEIINKGAKKATETAVDEVKRFHKQYVERYYASYNPSVYVRNDSSCNLYTTLLRSRIYDNTNATIWFGPDNLEFYKHPQSDPGMVFDSFITNSRRSSPAVEAKYPHDFGIGVVYFKPQKLNLKILTGFNQNITFENLLRQIPAKFNKKSKLYIVKYFNKEWDKFLNNYFDN